MRAVGAFIVTILTIALIFILDRPQGSLPALGRLLDPVNGWAAHAESTHKNFDAAPKLKELQHPVTVWFEERMVPHIRAANDHDLYYTLGYVHAYFRLWQMDMQTRAAAGRIGEVAGEKIVKDETSGKEKNAILEFDRLQRRKGMVYGAENSLKVMEADPRTKRVLDAYTAGINQYIRSLSYRDLPLEYKLMSFEPEPWSNLKCALLMKFMADDLTGYTEDFPLSALKAQLSQEAFDFLFPLRTPGSIPVIPAGTAFDAPGLPQPKVPEGVLWARFDLRDSGAAAQRSKDLTEDLTLNGHYETGVGSNNWAIHGNRTKSGAALLCNDPHLGLNLPSLWFEVQLTTPEMNVYGVSLPGAPGVIIGFNDSISWGLTNNYRDVKDFYEIEKTDNNSYRFDSGRRVFDKRIEIIKIKGQPDFIDKVNYTIHGPVIYDERFDDPLKSKKNIALTWMAHRGTNELLSIYLLNRAKNYQEFTAALMHFQCPAQNFVYADRQNNIALWGQGQFINKWKDQGRYVMMGNTSATLWGAPIPMQENPHILNPEQEYLVSANQMTTDSSYPYWYNGYFSDFREWSIHCRLHDYFRETARTSFDPLNTMHPVTYPFTSTPDRNLVDSLVTVEDMQDLQNSVFSTLNYNLPLVNSADFQLGDDLTWKSVAASKTQLLWSFLYKNIWEDEFAGIPQPLYPKEERTLQLILTDSNSHYYDDKRTNRKETFKDLVQRSLKQTKDSLKKQSGSSEWYKIKGTQLTHLAKIDAFSYKELKVGGWGNTINAVKKTHGPSWRMIVEMGRKEIKALGVYPGGQSGNPGSPFYGSFVKNWVAGTYYNLLFITSQTTQKPKEIKYTWRIGR